MPCAVQRAIVAGTKRRARADLPAVGIPSSRSTRARRHNAQLAYQPDAAIAERRRRRDASLQLSTSRARCHQGRRRLVEVGGAMKMLISLAGSKCSNQGIQVHVARRPFGTSRRRGPRSQRCGAGRVREIAVAPQDHPTRVAFLIVETPAGERILAAAALKSCGATVRSATESSAGTPTRVRRRAAAQARPPRPADHRRARPQGRPRQRRRARFDAAQRPCRCSTSSPWTSARGAPSAGSRKASCRRSPCARCWTRSRRASSPGSSSISSKRIRPGASS